MRGRRQAPAEQIRDANVSLVAAREKYCIENPKSFHSPVQRGRLLPHALRQAVRGVCSREGVAGAGSSDRPSARRTRAVRERGEEPRVSPAARGEIFWASAWAAGAAKL